MKNIKELFEGAINKMVDRNWDKLYITVDLHDTVLKSNYNGLATDFYPYAIESLQLLSKLPNVCLILWTSSSKKDIDHYIDIFKSLNINFNYINSNPEVLNNELSDFDSKFYTAIILDDKAGFDGEEDWINIYNYVNSCMLLTELIPPYNEHDKIRFEEYQNSGLFHPYTCCGEDGCIRNKDNDFGIMKMEENFIICPCGKYKQYWIHQLPN